MSLKEFKTYFTFSKAYMKMILMYRANVLMGIFGNALVLSVTFFLWRGIYKSSPKGIMQGFTLNEMLVYVIVTWLVSSIVYNDIAYTISQYVRSGDIAVWLIKPINFRRQLIFMALGQFLIGFLCFFLPMIVVINIYSMSKFNNVGILSMLIFILSMFLSFLVNAYYSYLFGLLSFKLYSIWGVMQVANAIVLLVSGSVIPLTFFPDIFQKIFEILPFSSIIYTPVMIYLGKLQGAQMLRALGLQVVWIVLLILLSKFAWGRVIKKLSVQGG